MARGDVYIPPYEFVGQQGQFDVIKINGVVATAHVERDGDGMNRIALVQANGTPIDAFDLTSKGIKHVFGVETEASRESGTWKLVLLIFPIGKEFGNTRKFAFLDTGIPVEWATVNG